MASILGDEADVTEAMAGEGGSGGEEEDEEDDEEGEEDEDGEFRRALGARLCQEDIGAGGRAGVCVCGQWGQAVPGGQRCGRAGARVSAGACAQLHGSGPPLAAACACAAVAACSSRLKRPSSPLLPPPSPRPGHHADQLEPPSEAHAFSFGRGLLQQLACEGGALATDGFEASARHEVGLPPVAPEAQPRAFGSMEGDGAGAMGALGEGRAGAGRPGAAWARGGGQGEEPAGGAGLAAEQAATAAMEVGGEQGRPVWTEADEAALQPVGGPGAAVSMALRLAGALEDRLGSEGAAEEAVAAVMDAVQGGASVEEALVEGGYFSLEELEVRGAGAHVRVRACGHARARRRTQVHGRAGPAALLPVLPCHWARPPCAAALTRAAFGGLPRRPWLLALRPLGRARWARRRRRRTHRAASWTRMSSRWASGGWGVAGMRVCVGAGSSAVRGQGCCGQAALAHGALRAPACPQVMADLEAALGNEPLSQIMAGLRHPAEFAGSEEDAQQLHRLVDRYWDAAAASGEGEEEEEGVAEEGEEDEGEAEGQGGLVGASWGGGGGGGGRKRAGGVAATAEEAQRVAQLLPATEGGLADFFEALSSTQVERVRQLLDAQYADPEQ